jgi:Domain of unknown function (DUF4159)/Aerotolerance regulator N-terminal
MMQWLSTLSFATPLALWGLALLPVIWWLLRFTPPRPQYVKFPPLRILLSLQSKEETPDKTPWWLLLLRLVMAAILIFAVAHPLLRKDIATTTSTGPLLVIIDDGWAAAKSWPKRQEALRNILEEARSANRTVTLATTTPNSPEKALTSIAAGDALSASRALQPQALNTDRAALLTRIKTQNIKAASVTWLSDGIDAGSATAFASGLNALFGQSLTALTFDSSDNPIALAHPTIDGGDIKVTALRNVAATSTATIQATAGNGRILAEVPVIFDGANSVTAKLNLPLELRNEIQSISIANENHAGARQLLDDRWRRKTIAIQSGTSQEAAQPLLSPLHYVTRALEPFADLREPADTAELKAQLEAGLSMLILADIGKLPQESHDAIAPWIEKGGVLLRFAGPRLAAATDDLVPVKLREGDRNLGSALSWETPQAIQTFAEKSPFAGLTIDDRVTVTRQVLAEPDIDLAEKTWVSLSDGTPLVTATRKGKGLIILFHVTANADWSNLPLTGTFVEMLQRIVDLAPAAGANTAVTNKDETSTSFTARLLLSGSSELVSPTANLSAIPVNRFDTAKASAQTPAGLYARGGQERAINLDLNESDLAPITGINLQKVVPPQTVSFAPQLFIAAALLFLLDTLAALLLGGGFNRPHGNTATAVLLALVCTTLLLHTPSAQADDQSAMWAALETHLAYVKTGNSDIDQTSEQGLKGLGLVMADRTSAILGDPVGINIESDDIVFYPLLYWPVTEDAETPGDAALARLDAFMKNGGTIFFDLRDNGGDFSSNSGTTEALKRILAKLDIPPLEPVPESHVLTRTFYLLKEFPGRYAGGALWVETQNADTTSNSDGVSGIIIGTNDYAAAWALDDKGEPLNAVIPGIDRQREMAFRVGVNVVMYALTGNYKTDQVHIPALLERLGQ